VAFNRPVHERTILRDLDFLRDSLGAPLAFCRKRNGYHYTNPSYAMPLVRLSRGELVALMLTEQLWRSCRGTPFARDVALALEKLVEAAPEEVSVDPAELLSAISVMPGTATPVNPKVFATLAEAVEDRKTLDLDYWSAERGERTRRQVDPYHMALIDGDWFLIGHCHLRGEVRMFAAQRVRAVTLLKEQFERPTEFAAEEYLRGSYRSVRGDGTVYEVRLKFGPKAAARVREKLWHPSQRLEETSDDGVVLCIEVTDLREIRRQVMWWGSDCEVLGPDELKQAVTEEAGRMIAYLETLP
jgi:proteasome accessory factor B